MQNGFAAFSYSKNYDPDNSIKINKMQKKEGDLQTCDPE